MLGDGIGKSLRDEVKRLSPFRPLPRNFRMEDAPVEIDGFSERRALRAQPPEVGGMVGVALDGHLAVFRELGDDAAADTAIGTGCLDLFLHHSAAIIRLSSAM